MSNAFVPTETIPDTLQWFMGMNPITYLVTATRDLMNEGTITITVIAAVVIVLIFAPLTVRAYMKRV